MTQHSLSQEIVQALEKKLLEEKKRIEVSLASLKTQDPFSDPDRLNDNAASDTEANEESSHERMEALEKELSQTLTDINDALARMQNNSYGVCERCTKQISEDRLMVSPTAKYCLDCEKKREE